ncbi:MAG: S-methyl-5-thioribose-1-phosphate isomerase [Candidatus Omnitrophota bacterium]|nr:MAG: S-methyl-5-thioribose-1-phosphate isomerase [Candidatus Omnitrophota bacterium]
MYAIKFKNNHLFYLDQTQLPLKEVYKRLGGLGDGYRAIQELRVRGAPLIGVFAAYCIALASRSFSSQKEKFLEQFKKATRYLQGSRPTAVNLFWALERLKQVAMENQKMSVSVIKKKLLREARAIHRQDIELCKKMAEIGARFVKRGDRILVHCNTGFLATSGEGTALAAIYKAHRIHKNIKVYVDETRPLLQGARLTSWELMKRKVPCTLICDNMAAYLMKKKEIDKVFVGADRIAASGDAANKIGTYSIAVLARYHKIPFYVVAPFSSFDLRLKNGDAIPIEKRSQDEVRKVRGKVPIAPANVSAWNPAFDVTPGYLISAIITDKGIITAPYRENIERLLRVK